MNQKRPLILASQSPRRSQLLRESGFQFQVCPLDVDESFPETMAPESVAPYLAEKKALAGKHLLTNRAILLTADSVVIKGGVVYNKPADAEEAYQMIEELAGAQHTVVTGVCLLAEEKQAVFSGVTQVWMEEMSPEEIRFYVDTYMPTDKAGGYGAQEWIGLCKINRMQGTYPNVMGLPVNLVYEALKDFDFYADLK
ncbi:MAG: Maf family nucleotide pyrophosphatase [Saprospiraceae bacterium]